AGHEHQDERDKDKAVAVASRCSGCFTSGWCSGRHHDGLPRRNREILGLQSVRAVSDLPSPFWTDSGEDGHPADGYVQCPKSARPRIAAVERVDLAGSGTGAMIPAARPLGTWPPGRLRTAFTTTRHAKIRTRC